MGQNSGPTHAEIQGSSSRRQKSFFRKLFPHRAEAPEGAGDGGPRPAPPTPSSLPFPKSIGPCRASRTHLHRGDVILVDGIGSPGGGEALFTREVFRRSRSLAALAARIDHVRGWTRLGASTDVIAARLSPPCTMDLPRATRREKGIRDGDEVQFAWLYAAQLDWAQIFYDSPDTLDSSDPDVSLFSVGGYLYFQLSPPSRSDGTSCQPASGIPGAAAPSGRAPASRGDPLHTEVSLLSANVVAYDPRGELKFSVARRLEERCADRLTKLSRFQPVTVQKWAVQGAKFMAWVRPGELLPGAGGQERALSRHGCLAFLFRGLDEPAAARQDRYFEVVSMSEFLGEAHPSLPSSSSLPYSVCAAPTQHRERQCSRLFHFAGRGEWPLVQHIVLEYPYSARECDDRGAGLLHYCAARGAQDKDLLESLRRLDAPYDARNADGKTAEELGDPGFRLALRRMWGRSLFEDPEQWFMFWDGDSDGHLQANELARALSTVYGLGDTGRRWIDSYVNTNHRAGITRDSFLGPQGLFHELQFSSKFVDLGRSRTPPLFHGDLPALQADERKKVALLWDRLAEMRTEYGWQPGQRVPRNAHNLRTRMPFEGGNLDVEARMQNARDMLSFCFGQTQKLKRKTWKHGFRVIFDGQEGVDDGGLTKAWGQEISFALWGNDDFFDPCGSDSAYKFFKPDSKETLPLDGATPSADLYKWTGRFVAYLLYQNCHIDCCLSPWAFRVLHRCALSPGYLASGGGCPEWAETPEGEDRMLEDLASFDSSLASNLWRVRHEMTDDELPWAGDFTGLKEGGEDIEVSSENKAEYVRLTCSAQLVQRARKGLLAFAEGFLDIITPEMFDGVLEGGVQRLLVGAPALTDADLHELEALVVPGGLLPSNLCEHPRVREAAAWFFRAVRDSDDAFRSRLLEFWTGTSRLPLKGVKSILPRPQLQIMVQRDGPEGIQRIRSWPKEKLPEGHTCASQLYLALQDSYEEAVENLRVAVENFEAGFALK